MTEGTYPTLQETLATIRSQTWLGKDRIRVLDVAEHAHRCPRISVNNWHFGIHIKIDGKDVATINGSDFACSTNNLAEAEKALGLENKGEEK